MRFRWNGRARRPLLVTVSVAALLPAASLLGAGPSGTPATSTQDASAAAQVLTDSQREAAGLLRAMTQHLAGLESFSFAFRDGYDVVQPTGQKIEFGEARRVTVARPDRLRVEEVSSDGTHDLALFDGHHISILNAEEGVFAQAPQPGILDDAIAYFVRDLRLRMPLALLLTTRLPESLPGRLRSIDYVERTEILGRPAHHIAGRAENVDFQFWIEDGERPWPLRVVITYVNSPGQPQFWANFAEWNTNPALAKSTFEFTPPPGARRIAFAVQVRRDAGTAQLPDASGEVRP